MTQTYIGASITRKEDFRFLTGRATYTDDVKVQHVLHAAIVRSPHAHARLLSIDTGKALELPGVVAVYTHKEAAESLEIRPIPMRMAPLPGIDRFLQYPLAQDKVRYVGEPVAVVIAEDRYLAEDAVDLIEVAYEPLPAITDAYQSLRNETLLHEQNDTNVACDFTMTTGDVEQAFRDAEYTHTEEFHVQRHTANPLETRGILASYDKGRDQLDVWGETKTTHFNRKVMSSLLQMPEHRIHFYEPDVGGGFGVRGEFYPEDFIIPFASIKLGRPIKWIEDRREHLLSANHSREHICRLEVAAKRDGTILGLRVIVYGDIGAYVRTHGVIVPTLTASNMAGPYRVPNFEGRVVCLVTNKVGTGTYRGPGGYEQSFSRERFLDIMAQDLGIDIVELRKKNLISPEEMPYDTGIDNMVMPHVIYDSGDYPAALEAALDAINYDAIKHLQGQLVDGKLHGIGFGSMVEPTGVGPFEGARVVVTGPEQVAVYLGVATMGQGHETAIAQICADGLGVPMEHISFHHKDTDQMPFGIGTFASRVTVMGGNAVYQAAQELRQKIVRIAAGYLDVPPEQLEFVDGHIRRVGSSIEGPLLDMGQVLELAGPTSRYNQGEMGLETTYYFRTEQIPYSYGAHATHITVDPETYKIEVLDYVVVEDVGRVINPLLVKGQVIGAAAQGIGATILEDLAYDSNGQPLATTFMDYLLPTSTDMPPVQSIELDLAPSPLNPLGVKGAGEGGIVCTGASLANAVSHALGVQVHDLPLSPDKLRALAKGRAEGA